MMNSEKITFSYVAPVLLTFFVMSAGDLVGIGVDNVKADFGLNNTLAQFIPLAVFVWFFLLAVPTGLLQDRIGKRNMLDIGILLTAMGLFLPFFFYSFLTVMVGFALLGIGNTIIQVSANPLLFDVVPSGRVSSFLSFSQFVKSVGSMAGPYLTAFFVLRFGDWKLIFMAFGMVSLLSAGWLHFTKITESIAKEEKATLSSCLKLLGTGYVALMVSGIFFAVGIDVGINATSGQFLLVKLQMSPDAAQQGRSLYFFGKMLGTFLGALLLVRFSSGKFLTGSAAATLLATLFFILSPTPVAALILMFITGLVASNIFPLIFTITIKKFPARANEISGLMIMAVSGGAIIPPVIGAITDMFSITAGMYVLVFCALYLLLLSAYSYRR